MAASDVTSRAVRQSSPLRYEAIADPSVRPDLRLFFQTFTDLSPTLEVTVVRRAGTFVLTVTCRSEICSYCCRRHRNTAQTLNDSREVLSGILTKLLGQLA